MKRKSLLALLILCFIPVHLGGASQKEVSLSFGIEEMLWRIKFANDIDWIEAEGLQEMRGVLKEHFGFLDFKQEPADYMLMIALKNRDQTTDVLSPMKEVVIEMSMSRKKSNSDESEGLGSLFWTFRSPEFYELPLGEKDGFLNQVLSSFKEYVKDNNNMIVANLFSKVPLADKAYLVEGKRKWYLPLSCRLLCVELDSEFMIETKIDEASEIYVERYHTRLIGVTKEQVPGVPELYWDGKIITVPIKPDREMKSGFEIKVWLRRYIPPQPGGLTFSSPSELVIKDEEERR